MSESYQISYSEWMTLQTQLLWCYDNPVGFAGRVQRTNAPRLSAWLIRSGQCVVESEGQKVEATEGQWMVPRPGQRTQFFAEPTHIVSVAFQCQWPTGEHLFDDGLSMVVDASAFPELEKTALAMAQTVRQCFPKSDWRIMGEVLPLSGFLQIGSVLPAWLRAFAHVMMKMGLQPARLGDIDARVLAVVRVLQNLSVDAVLNADVLAEQVGLSRTQLDRLYRKYIRCTPRQHFERLRLDYARNHLLMPEARIKEVALELGFEHLAHFSRWFRRLQGSSPRAFKEGRSLQ